MSQGQVKPIKTRLSNDGSLAGVLVNELENWWIQIFDTDSGRMILTVKAEGSPTSDFYFLNDDMLLYAAESGLALCNLRNGNEMWKADITATHIAVSSDETTAATINRDESKAYLWDIQSGDKLGEADFNGRHLRFLTGDTLTDLDDSLFALNADGRRMAVSFSDGSLSLYDFRRNGQELALFDAGDTDCTHFEGGFSGSFFAVALSGGTKSYFLLADAKEEQLENMRYVTSSENMKAFHLQTDETGIYLWLPTYNILSEINPNLTGENDLIKRRLGETDSEISAFNVENGQTLIQCKNGDWLVFDSSGQEKCKLTGPFTIDQAWIDNDYALLVNRSVSSLVIQKWEQHQDKDLLHYDSSFTHLEANIHTDKQSAMLFWRKEFFVVGLDGSLLAQVEIPDREQIRDIQYRRVGTQDRLGQTAEQDYLEIWYYNGMVRSYSAKTGAELFVEQGPLPQESGASKERNEEIMETGNFRAVSPVNSSPIIYDKTTGEVLGTLNSNGNLMYIYQIGDGFIAHYMVTGGKEKYGELLSRDCQVMADMPGLTDVLPDGTLVFDDNSGNLRQERIYSIEELISMGHKYEEANQ